VSQPILSKNLESCIEAGQTNAIKKFCFEYIDNCDFSSSYQIDEVCTKGNIKLYCGYFQGVYGLIIIEILGLYPKEIEHIESNLIPGIRERIQNLPRKRGMDNFNYETTANGIVIRFYVVVSGDRPVKEELVKLVNDLAPALEFLTKYIEGVIIRGDK